MLTLVGLIVAFVVIIILIRRKFNFGVSLIIGSLILGLFSLEEIQPLEIGKAFVEASVYSFENNQIYTETIELAMLSTWIFVLAKTMQDTGAIKKLIASLRTFLTKGKTLGVIPAVYGLMPVQGGALFSAPLIDEEGDKYNLDKNQKNLLNIWFRHVWFPIYPVSAAMILICSEKFAHINITNLILFNTPAFIATILIGTVLLKKFTKNSKIEEKIERKRDYAGLVYLIPPIIPLISYGILQFFGISQIRCFIIGLFFSMLILYLLLDISAKDYFHIAIKSLTWKLALAILGIMIFRQMFEVSKANVLLFDIISSLHIPVILMAVIIPLILGTVTGYNLGAIALSYPLLAPFFPLTGSSIVVTGLASIIFVSALVGYLISPIHLCNVLSSEYLKTDTTRMYKIFIPSAITMLMIQVLAVIFVCLPYGIVA